MSRPRESGVLEPLAGSDGPEFPERDAGLLVAAYVVSGLFFIMSIGTLRHPGTVIASASAPAIGMTLRVLTARTFKWGVRGSATELLIRGLRPRRIAWTDITSIAPVQGPGLSRIRVTRSTGRPLRLPAPIGYGWTHEEYDHQVEQLVDWWQTHGGAQRVGEIAGHPQPGQTASDNPWAAPPGT